MAKLFLVLVATCATTLATTTMPTTNASGASLSAFLTNLKEGLTNLKEGSENLLDMVQRFETEQSTQIDQSNDQDKVRYLALAETCAELAYYGPFESGEYEIDPDGYGVRRNGPIRVFCDFTTNSTVIRHNLGNEVSLENHFLQRGPQGASVDINYDAPMDQIVSLLNNPTSRCKQEILFSCNVAPLVIDNHTLASFKYRYEANTQDITCADSTTSCNCNSSSPELLQDRIVITDKRLLPVTGFTYGPFKTQHAQASVEIKSLECKQEPTITRDDCNSTKFLTSNRIQFNMENKRPQKPVYSNGKKCYAEVYLPAQADLKLTVSNFNSTENGDFLEIFERSFYDNALKEFTGDVGSISYEWMGNVIALRWRHDYIYYDNPDSMTAFIDIN